MINGKDILVVITGLLDIDEGTEVLVIDQRMLGPNLTFHVPLSPTFMGMVEDGEYQSIEKETILVEHDFQGFLFGYGPRSNVVVIACKGGQMGARWHYEKQQESDWREADAL